jgi:hypothetical protein
MLGRKPPSCIIGFAGRQDLVCLAVIASRLGRNCLEARINSFRDTQKMSAHGKGPAAASLSDLEGRNCLRGLEQASCCGLSPKVKAL